MADHSNMKLGRRPAKHLRSMPMLSRYTVALPAPPANLIWTGGRQDWGMLLNDSIGDCTIAGLGHIIQLWGDRTNRPAEVADETILDLYKRWCGYDPADTSTDQGGVETDVLRHWLAEPIAGHSLAAMTSVNPKSRIGIETAIWLFGAAYIGVGLPNTSTKQDVWDVVPGWENDPDGAIGSLGGHCIILVGYNPRHVTAITWGSTKLLTWDFLDAYCEEAYGLLSSDWIAPSGVAPSGFDLAALREDMLKLK